MEQFNTYITEIGEYGIVEQVRTPLAIISGLMGAHLNEIVVFESGEKGQVFMVQKDAVTVLIFSKESVIVGTRVTRTNQFLSVPVGNDVLSKMIDPLGGSLVSNQPEIMHLPKREIDTKVVGMVGRVKITQPFYTGTSLIDMLVPLGKGQKELVIGDRKTGKTSFLLTAMKTQAKNGVKIIYGAIGKKKSDIKRIRAFFEQEGLTDSTVIVATSSYDSPSLIYLTPYSAVTIAEFFRDQGQETLVVLDDLSTHAKFYREISLLANRFPGRESYPGDIFYTHARLLERAGNYDINGKEVSVTILPVAELVEGDFSGYIATNLMGITDGHIYFDSNSFYEGKRPAVNVSLSVTRVGKQTQSKLRKSITQEITAFLGTYQKMQNLSHFGAELTDTVKNILSTGELAYNFFEQHYNTVLPINVQIVLFGILWLKFFPEASISEIRDYRERLISLYEMDEGKKYIDAFVVDVNSFNELLSKITQKKEELIKICLIKTK